MYPFYCSVRLTVSHEIKHDFHLGQRVEAGKVRPLGAAGLGRLLPAACFCFGQHPVAEATVGPPAVITLCLDILPVLCMSKKNPGRNRDQNTLFQHGFTDVHTV